MIRKIARYGWRLDALDPRDLIYNLEERILPSRQLPATADLEAEMPPIYDQGQLGSCSANSVGAVMQHAQLVEGEPEGAHVPSRLFVYYNERVIENTVPTDSGAQIRDGIKTLVTLGAPPEELWPYDDSNPGPFTQLPPSQVYEQATRYEAIKYQRIQPGVGAPIRTALHKGLPIAFGFTVPDYFEDPAWNPVEQALPLPSPTTQFIGGHAVVIMGYDFTRARFPVNVVKVRNSWGAGWGERGHFWMDVAWLDPRNGLSSDFWVVSKTS